MKKKLSILMLSLFIIPLIALFGCGEVSSYAFFVYSSSSIYGSVTGAGTFNDGTAVTLSASTKQGSYFICWVHENSTEIENDSTYRVSNTTNSSEKIEKSVLTFSASSKTQGKYTAVFSDNKMMYTKLESYRITSTPDEPGEEDDMTKSEIMTLSMALYQNSSTAYTAENVSIKDNVLVNTTDIKELFKLETSSAKTINASTQITYSNRSISLNFRADVNFQTSTDWIQTTNYSYKIVYADGAYQIMFEFKLSADTTYYLVLNYSNLK